MDVKGEANIIKVNKVVEKIADKINIGVNRENNTINLVYIDNRQLNFSIPLPKDTETISDNILKKRAEEIIDKQLEAYKPKLLQEILEKLKEGHMEASLASIIAISGASIASSAPFLTSGNLSDIYTLKEPPEIKFI